MQNGRSIKPIPISFDVVDDVILVDDFSSDDTVKVAKHLGITQIIVHEKNTGYGGNQKTCYRRALDLKADIVVMLIPIINIPHISFMRWPASSATGSIPVVFGSRILGKGALRAVCRVTSTSPTGC